MTTYLIRNYRKSKAQAEQANQGDYGDYNEPILSKGEQIRLKRERKAKINRAILNGIVAIVLAVIVGLPVAFIKSPEIGIGAALSIVAMFLSYQYPRMGLWAFLIYMPFSGTVIYWLAGGSAVLQVAKDVFYFPALIALMIDCRRRNQPIFVAKQLNFTLSLLFAICLATLVFVNSYGEFFFDFEGSPLLQGLMGLKILMGYIPLIFCAYYLIEDKKTLLRLGRVLVTLAVICCILGVMQYLWFKTGRCTPTTEITSGAELFKAGLHAKCLVGGSALYSPQFGQIRLPGTFVSPWHWGWFLIANSAICYIVAFFDPYPFWRLWGSVGMGLVLFNSLVCGQRIALVAAPMFIMTMLIGTGQIFRVKRFLPVAIVVGVAITVYIVNNPDFVMQRIDNFIARWNHSPPHLFIVDQFDWAVRNYRLYNVFGIFGAGLGKGTSATRFFGEIRFLETFHPKLIYEIGYIGFFLYMAFITNLVILGFKKYRSLQDTTLQSFALAFLIFIIIIGYFPYWYPLDTDPVSSYYWLFAGVLIKLPVIDKQERGKQIEQITHKGKQKRKKPASLKKRYN